MDFTKERIYISNFKRLFLTKPKEIVKKSDLMDYFTILFYSKKGEDYKSEEINDNDFNFLSTILFNNMKKPYYKISYKFKWKHFNLNDMKVEMKEYDGSFIRIYTEIISNQIEWMIKHFKDNDQDPSLVILNFREVLSNMLGLSFIYNILSKYMYNFNEDEQNILQASHYMFTNDHFKRQKLFLKLYHSHNNILSKETSGLFNLNTITFIYVSLFPFYTPYDDQSIHDGLMKKIFIKCGFRGLFAFFKFTKFRDFMKIIFEDESIFSIVEDFRKLRVECIKEYPYEYDDDKLNYMFNIYDGFKKFKVFDRHVRSKLYAYLFMLKKDKELQLQEKEVMKEIKKVKTTESEKNIIISKDSSMVDNKNNISFNHVLIGKNFELTKEITSDQNGSEIVNKNSKKRKKDSDNDSNISVSSSLEFLSDVASKI